MESNITKEMAFETVRDRVGSLQLIWDGLSNDWERDDEQYNNLIEERNYVGNSRVRVPATFDAVETLVSFGVNAVFSSDMPVQAKAPEKGDIARVELLNKAARIKMGNMKPTNFRERNSRAFRKLHKFGMLVVKCPFNKTLHGADFLPCRNEEVLFDPFVPDYEPLDFIVHKVRRSRAHILKKKHLYPDVTKEMLNELAKESEHTAGNAEGVYRHTKSEFGLSDQVIRSNVPYYDLHEVYFNYDYDGTGNEVECIMVTINNKRVIRFTKSPYEGKPFLFCSLVEQEGTRLGRGTPRLIRQQQIELNDYRSQTLDVGTVSLQPMYSVDRLAEVNATQLKYRPHGVVYSMQPGGGVTPIKRDLHPEIGIQMSNLLVDDIAKLSGATPSLMDILVEDVTAFESRRALNASTRRVLEMTRKYVDNILIPWFKLDMEYTKKWVDFKDFMRMVGVDAADEGEASLKEFFDADYDAIAVGLTEVENKMIKIQQLQYLLNVGRGIQGANVLQLFADIADQQGLDGSKYVFLPPKPELKNPVDENTLMMQGQKVKPNPRDPHQQHRFVHGQLDLGKVPTEQRAAVAEMLDEHLRQHMEMEQAIAGAGGQAGPQVISPQEMSKTPTSPEVPEGTLEGQAQQVGRMVNI